MNLEIGMKIKFLPMREASKRSPIEILEPMAKHLGKEATIWDIKDARPPSNSSDGKIILIEEDGGIFLYSTDWIESVLGPQIPEHLFEI